jgi:hypothetical protein
MNYTNYILLALGLFGILIHNLIKIDKVNRESDGEIKWRRFFRLEWPSITLSVCVVIVCLIAKHEVKKLEAVGEWLGLSFVAIGYMAQSIVYKFLGKAEKRLNGDKN